MLTRLPAASPPRTAPQVDDDAAKRGGGTVHGAAQLSKCAMMLQGLFGKTAAAKGQDAELKRAAAVAIGCIMLKVTHPLLDRAGPSSEELRPSLVPLACTCRARRRCTSASTRSPTARTSSRPSRGRSTCLRRRRERTKSRTGQWGLCPALCLLVPACLALQALVVASVRAWPAVLWRRRYYTGRLLAYDEDYAAAEQHLSFALQHCHKDAHENKRRILRYLIPVRVQGGGTRRVCLQCCSAGLTALLA